MNNSVHCVQPFPPSFVAMFLLSCKKFHLSFGWSGLRGGTRKWTTANKQDDLGSLVLKCKNESDFSPTCPPPRQLNARRVNILACHDPGIAAFKSWWCHLGLRWLCVILACIRWQCHFPLEHLLSCQKVWNEGDVNCTRVT